MALSPSIPTSFVPKQPVATGRRRYTGNGNIFLVVSIIIFVIAIVAAAGVFLYSSYLQSVVTSKQNELSAAQADASPDTVEQFIRLRDRFSAAKGILNNHIALSQFLSVFENTTLQDVRFTNLGILVASDRSAKLTLAGQAKSFNALANESTAFAAQPYIKSAIFSDITVNPDNSVSFRISANLDPRIVTEQTAPTTPVLLNTATIGTSTSSSLPTTAAAAAASAVQQTASTTSATTTPSTTL